jgi:hypothetical protein
MSRKIYAALVPLAAVVAFAIAPAVAQAAARWSKCEHFAAATHNRVDNQCSEATATGHWELKELPTSEAKTQVITAGKLTLKANNGVTVECKVLDAGNVWNPATVASPGKDNIEVFVNYECKSAQCATVSVTAENLPYETELETGPPIRDKIKAVQITVNCAGTPLTFKGELKPKIINATLSNNPTFAEFEGEGSGVLENEAKTVKATVEGHDRIGGFEAFEGIFA